MLSARSGSAGLGVHLTGAGRAWSSQRDAGQSLGGFPSAVEVLSLTPVRSAALPGVWIEGVGPGHSPGVGVLEGLGGGQYRWTPPGGAAGAVVSVPVDTSTVLFGGGVGGVGKYLVVRRSALSSGEGSEAVQLIDTYGNAVGGGDVESADALSGASEYRALVLWNRAASGSITNLRAFVGDGEAEIQLGSEALVSGALQTIPDLATAPTSVIFGDHASLGAALSLGTVAAGAGVGLWVRRFVSPGRLCSAHVLGVIELRWTQGGVDYSGQLRGVHRVANASAEAYALYLKAGEDPDPDVDSPVASGASLPLSYDVALGEGVWHVGRWYTNAWGLRSAVGVIDRIAIDAEGVETKVPPSAPQQVGVSAKAAGAALVTASYHPRAESASVAEVRARRANQWLVYVRTDGTAPDPEVDEPEVVNMQCALPDTAHEASLFGRESLFFDVPAALDGAPVQVVVRCRRRDEIPAEDEEDPPTVKTYDSASSAVVSCEAVTVGPAMVRGYASLDGVRGVAQGVGSTGTGTWYGDDDEISRVEYAPGSASFYVGDLLVWRCLWDSGSDTGRLYFPEPWNLVNASVSGAASSGPVEVVQWDESAKVAHVSVNGVRRMTIDGEALTITFDEIDQVSAVVDVASGLPVFARWAETLWSVWEPGEERWRAYMSVRASGVVRLPVEFDQRFSQSAVEAL